MMNDQDSDNLLRRFRLALHTVERSPSDEALGELRSAAAPILDQLRAEYRAAGHTDGDCTAMFRRLRATLADRELGATRSSAVAPRRTRESLEAEATGRARRATSLARDPERGGPGLGVRAVGCPADRGRLVRCSVPRPLLGPCVGRRTGRDVARARRERPRHQRA